MVTCKENVFLGVVNGFLAEAVSFYKIRLDGPGINHRVNHQTLTNETRQQLDSKQNSNLSQPCSTTMPTRVPAGCCSSAASRWQSWTPCCPACRSKWATPSNWPATDAMGFYGRTGTASPWPGARIFQTCPDTQSTCELRINDREIEKNPLHCFDGFCFFPSYNLIVVVGHQLTTHILYTLCIYIMAPIQVMATCWLRTILFTFKWTAQLLTHSSSMRQQESISNRHSPKYTTIWQL